MSYYPFSKVSTIVNHNSMKPLSKFLIVIAFFPLLNCTYQKEKPFLLGQGLGLNSATLFVDDLYASIKYYKDTLGFDIRSEIEPGTIRGTLTTSVGFGDMTSLEFLSINDSSDLDSIPAYIREFLAEQEGIRLFSLSSSSLDSTYLSLTSNSFLMDSIISYRTSVEESSGWSWDDGGDQRKLLNFRSDNPPAELPQFIESIGYNYPAVNREWNTYYIYRRMFRNHPNGVVGISAIRIAVNDLEDTSESYSKMGLEPIEQNDTIARFRLYRDQELHLVSSNNSQSTKDFIEERGSMVYALRFDVAYLDSTILFFEKALPEESLEKSDDMLTIKSNFARGVQLEFVQEPASQKQLVKKLSPTDVLDSTAVSHASQLYTKYCALCHGENREGYAADNAPSLRSRSLLASSKGSNFIRYTIQYGRANTAMAGYLDTQGGPMEFIEIELLMEWLYQTAEVEESLGLSREPVLGDITTGASLYDEHCAVCHGKEGEGVTAPALSNPMLLATATDHFLRYAIAEGRDGTPMIAFDTVLDSLEINSITAFLRSRASGWDIPKPDTVSIPLPENYVLNPDADDPLFDLKEGRYVSAVQMNQAYQDSLRMIILDARSEVAWRQMHIPGAIPVPYYEEPENFIDDIPNDGTQIVIYCACPHAASNRVRNTLVRNGFTNVAIIDEGILVWAQMGFPVRSGS